MGLGAQCVLDCRPQLRELGVDLQMEPSSGMDATIDNWLLVKHRGRRSPQVPSIIYDEGDSAQVPNDLRAYVASEQLVCGVIKPSLFRDRSRYTAMKHTMIDYPRETREALRCGATVFDTEPFDATLLHLAPSYGCYGRLGSLKTACAKLPTEREIPISFHGTTVYGSEHNVEYGNAASVHREACVQAVDDACFSGGGLVGSTISDHRSLSRSRYWEELRDSKICVSPWGWATACHRDYEAILCGCRMVKPLSEHITAFPDIYDPSPWYAVCKPDFSDLREVVDSELAKWDDNADSRDGLRDVLIAQSKPEKVAAHIASVIHKCLERAK